MTSGDDHGFLGVVIDSLLHAVMHACVWAALVSAESANAAVLTFIHCCPAVGTMYNQALDDQGSLGV